MSEKNGYPSRRKEIVDAARTLAAEQGWPAVTVRAVASRIGCSAPALYLYFRDKDDILDALAAEGRNQLAESMEKALSDVGHGPAKRLRAAVRLLWDFAMANPEIYAVMFGLSGQACHGGGAGPADGEQTYQRKSPPRHDRRPPGLNKRQPSGGRARPQATAWGGSR